MKICIFAMSKASNCVDEASTKQIYWEKSPKGKEVIIDCCNDVNLLWVSAQEKLTEADNLEIQGPLSGTPLQASSFLKETNVLNVDHLMCLVGNTSLPRDSRLRACKQIVHYFPVVYATTGEKSALINMHELIYTKHGTFEQLLLLSDADVKQETTPVSSSGHSAAKVITTLPAEKRTSTKALEIPWLVEETVRFIQLHGFSAQVRRRTPTGNMCGVTLTAIKQHLMTVFPKLQKDGISTSTIRYLMVAPNKHYRAAASYKGLINAKVPPKSNTRQSSVHMDTHYCRSQVNLAMELAFDRADENLCISCDDKNSVNIGTTVSAVSRYHHVDRIFMEGDAVNHFDHSFPQPNSKIKHVAT